jgi:hypothetical protein
MAMTAEVMEKSMAVPNRKIAMCCSIWRRFLATLDVQDGDGGRTYTEHVNIEKCRWPNDVLQLESVFRKPESMGECFPAPYHWDSFVAWCLMRAEGWEALERSLWYA